MEDLNVEEMIKGINKEVENLLGEDKGIIGVEEVKTENVENVEGVF